MSEATEQSKRTPERREVMIEVEGLRKYYGEKGLLSGPPVKAVDGVDFSIYRGETFGLVGESGCGKSTLGRTLIRLEKASSGTVSFEGTDVTSLSGQELKEWRQNAQMVFQDPDSSLNDRMTVGEIIREPLDANDWKDGDARTRRVRELLNQVGLQEEHYYRYPHQFSGGQRQRIGIARALALEPKFIVLDEPVSALDVSVQAKIISLLEDLQEEFDLTYLFIAHDLSVVRHICDRVAVMYLGKIMEIGETEDLFRNPANPYTRSLLSAIPRPNPSENRTRITLPGTPPSPRNPPAGCQFSTRCPAKIRPEGYENLDEATWDAVERFREVVRERARLEMSAADRLRRNAGLFSKFDDIEDTIDEQFGDIDVPDEVETHIRTAADHVRDGYPQKAQQYLAEEFNSVCDTDRPDLHPTGDGEKLSYCHRHTNQYEDVEDVVERRTHDD